MDQLSAGGQNAGMRNALAKLKLPALIESPGPSSPMVKTRFKGERGRPNFIRKWRKFRGYTLEKVAEMTEKSVSTISQIETFKQPYTQETLELIAEALQCEPADLLMRDPTDTAAIWSLWERAKPRERKQIINIVESLLEDADE